MSRDNTTVVDFGAHFHPDPPDIGGLFDYIEETAGAPVQNDIDAVADLYERAGIDAAVLSQPKFIGHDDREATRAGNDEYLEILEEYPQFYALAALPTGGEATARELERCLDKGFNGGAFEIGHGHPKLIDESMEPLLEVADDTGAPLLVHPKIMDSIQTGALDDKWALNGIFGREVILAASICRVIHEGVLDKYPDLNLVYHHNGGNIAPMLERVELQIDERRWAGLDHLRSYDEFEAQLEERIYIDTSGYGPGRTAFRDTLDKIPASNVLYATDFPYETRTPEQFCAIVESLKDMMPRTDARRVLGENTLDLLVNVD